MRYRELSPRRPAEGGPAGRLVLALVLMMAASLSHIVPCRAAGLVIQAPDISGVRPGSSGSFDVLLIDTDPAGTPGYNVAGDSLELQLSGSAGSSIQFTDATIRTASAPYLFTRSLVGDYGLPLFTNPLPDTVLITSDAGDIVGGYPGYTTVNPGDTFGLADVSYTISSAAALGTSDSLSFVLTNGATSLSDPDGNAISFATVNGSIVVGSAIPEPTTLTLGTIAVLIGLGASGWRGGADRQRSSRLWRAGS